VGNARPQFSTTSGAAASANSQGHSRDRSESDFAYRLDLFSNRRTSEVISYSSQTHMPWTRKLTLPIQLKDDRVPETVADVWELMLSLPERPLQNGHWVYAGELLLDAVTRKGVTLHDVQQQLSIALKAEGLI
jgi:hypothetical protein